MSAADPARWAALSPRLDELLTLPPLERAARLDEIAANDPGTAARLRDLLHARDEASRVGFLGGVADATALPVTASVGDALGAWTLVEPIGEGGMGSVWRARRNDGRYDGEAAVKLLRTGLFDPAAQERFRREGAILARLRHPGIAQLLDAGVTGRGQPYLVLELVRGEPIDRWCHARRLGPRETLATFTQVLDAVAAAHAQLVIHRDLKPSNVLVDDAGRVTLLDFGIARLQDEGVDAGLTREGALALTPRYAAPEQAAGDALSMATDVYALGVMLHELLTGEHPSGLPAGASLADYLRASGAGRLRRASEHASLPRRRALRGDLDAILAKALSLQPDDRYASVGALRDDLHRHLRHEPIAAQSAGPWKRLVKLVRRRPFEAAVVAAVALAVPAGAHLQAAVLVSMGAGTGAALWQARRARRQAAVALTEQQRADAVKTFIASTFKQATPREGAGGVVTANDLLHAAAERAGKELKDQPLVAAELMALVGESFIALGDMKASQQVLPDAVARCEQAFGRRHPLTLNARCQHLEAFVVMGDLDTCERLLPALVSDLRAQMPTTARQLVDAMASDSFVLTKRGREAEAVRVLQDALAIAREHLGPADPDTLGTAGFLGNTLSTFDRDDEALVILEQTVAVARQTWGAQRPHTQLARVEAWLASVLSSQSRMQEAVTLLRQVLQDQLMLDGTDTNRNRYTRSILARALAECGDLEEALAEMRTAVAADARLVPGPTVDKGTMVSQLGLLLAMAGHPEEGLAEMQRAEDITRAAGGGQVGPTLSRQVQRAQALLLAGEAAPALAAVDAVLAQAADVTRPAQAIARRVRVAALHALGRLSEAEEALPAMIDAARAAGVSTVQQGRAAIEAAGLLHTLCRASEARVQADTALALLLPTQSAGSALLAQARALAAQAAGAR